jgi:4-carboxymuconolactone decarboxylase
MAKLSAHKTSQLKSKTTKLYQQLLELRGGKKLGMYSLLLYHPDLLPNYASLGNCLRFHGLLPDDIRETTILYVGEQCKAPHVWKKHLPLAKKAGLSQQWITEIKNRKRSTALKQHYGKYFKLARLVIKHKNISQKLQDLLLESLTTAQLVELVVLIGFYSMCAGLLNAFDVG